MMMTMILGDDGDLNNYSLHVIACVPLTLSRMLFDGFSSID
jgi:hypothetical protein